MEIISYICGYIIVPLFAAFIGTWWGARKLIQFKEQEKEKVRSIALKAIEIFKKYAKNNNLYNSSESDFNNSMTIAEKRAVLVALYKLGIPIAIPLDGEFIIEKVSFLDREIDKNNLEEIESQIRNGYVDSLFFDDPDKYFNKDLRIKTLRNLAKRYVNDVMRYSHSDEEGKEAIFDVNYNDIFTYFEANAILVFREKTLSDAFYKKGKPVDKQKLEKLIIDIDQGLCDMYFNIDVAFYINLVNQRKISELQLSTMKAVISQQEEGSNLVNKENYKNGENA